MDPFYTKGGKEVTSLDEMADALESMPDDEFSHHVTPQRNDVAMWVEDVHHNEGLAKALSQAKDKDTMIKLIKEVGSASFPNSEEYHPLQGAGKEDADLHETYNKPEEWQAAKEAAHPNEDVQNPANNSLQQLANEHNNNIPEENQGNLEQQNNQELEVPVDDNSQEQTQETQQTANPTNEAVPPLHPEQNVVAKDLNPSEHSMKDKLIFGVAGFIVGIIVGYGIAWLLG